MASYWTPLSQRWIAFFVCVLLSSTFSSGALGRGVSPYLPEKLSPILENEVERLAVIAGIPNLTRPYSLATIFHYMEQIKDSHPRLYRRLSDSLRAYGKKGGITHARIGVQASDETVASPNGRGNTVGSAINLSLRSQFQFTDWFALYGGLYHTTYHETDSLRDGSRNNTQPAGTTLSLGLDWAQLDIGYKDYWLSPFQSTAQLLSTQAENLKSISLSNNLPIEFLSTRWNYQIFLAETSRQPVAFNGEFDDEDPPLLAGLHIGFQPTPWWSLAATRVFQFGGGQRPVDLSTLARAFFDPRGGDNDASVDEESGNQVAAISSKINFDGRLPFSLAVELAGEDTSNNKDFQLGNTALTTGLFFPYFFSEDISLTYEYSTWQNGWYVNNVFSEGFTNEGFILGNWAFEVQNDNGTSTEGSSSYLKVQWQTSFDHIIAAQIRTTEHVSTEEVSFDRSFELELDYSFAVGQQLVTLGVYGGETSLGDSFGQLSASIEW